jgi:hypothetical protein
MKAYVAFEKKLVDALPKEERATARPIDVRWGLKRACCRLGCDECIDSRLDRPVGRQASRRWAACFSFQQAVWHRSMNALPTCPFQVPSSPF